MTCRKIQRRIELKMPDLPTEISDDESKKIDGLTREELFTKLQALMFSFVIANEKSLGTTKETNDARS